MRKSPAKKNTLSLIKLHACQASEAQVLFRHLEHHEVSIDVRLELVEARLGHLQCLNQHHFATLSEARAVVEQWRQEYNTERPHRGLAQRTPAEYAALFTPEEGHSSMLTLR